MPPHIKDGRFGNWLENARDWAVSRNRFWGAPIPVWRCNQCKSLHVIGSREELQRLSGRPVNDFHRPKIDEHTFQCSFCPGTMVRVPDVLDCWFESGAMPYAQVHYPFECKSEFEAAFPGDFIVEYIAQTRGWFYTMTVLSTALFDSPPFRDAVCHGVILAEDGRKMSKRLKNYPDPMHVVEEYGSDALRIALLSCQVVSGEDIRFSKDAVRDAARRFCIPLWNCLHYFTAYASIDRFEPTGLFPRLTRLDRYLLSETEALRAGIESGMQRYDFQAIYRLIEDYIESLSTWYIRLTKPRLWRSDMDDDKRTAYEVLYASLHCFLRLSAPFLPFLADMAWGILGESESVHLRAWPVPKPEWQHDEVVSEMRSIRDIVRLARSIREKNGLKHRHPLRRISIAGLSGEAIKANLDLLQSELNVKEICPLLNPHEHVRSEIKLNYPRLGARLRGEIKAVAAQIGAGRYSHNDDGTLVVGGVRLESDDYESRYVARQSGMAVAASEKFVVLLDLATAPDLIDEGLVRDLNRELQDLRKFAHLAYSDRVILSIIGPRDLLDAVDRHRQWLADQLLAEEILNETIHDETASVEVEIGGMSAKVAIKRVSESATPGKAGGLKEVERLKSCDESRGSS
jgi:isoleucyl-tRNA synthetase